ncbi:Cytochrome P450 [Geosmithia morbida]|uniref:Cytochrome P450 n=1 Tax=Geosmithia morbida TaxID=1094350 RepID=A0A9P4YUL7_9HYPO|nr:Cytochrome P450 [Geosmithia morbida]KAF4122832.1 Cytochrome P450 [Geosmithia morbida]
MGWVTDLAVDLGRVQRYGLAFFVLMAILAVAYRVFFTVRYSPDLPRVGADAGISWKEMRNKFHTDCLSVFEDIYENYSKKGKAVLMPVFGPHDEVILPPSALAWLCKQPDHVMSSLEAQVDSIQLHHSLGNKFAYDPWGGMLIKSDLNSAIETVCAVLNDELRAAFSSCFGEDTENWNELDLFPACRVIGGRATLRFTLGDSTEGRRADKGFVDCCYDVLDGMLDTAGTMAASRKIVKRFLGPWVSRAMPAKLRDLAKRIEPLHRERLQIIKDQGEGKDCEVPQDLFQMMMQYAARERPNELNNVNDIAGRIAVSNFGTMHQTIITLHNLFLNIIDSNGEFDTLNVLRQEVVEVLGLDEGGDTTTKRWTKAKVSAMVKADSVGRETLRVNSFIGRTVQRLVIAPQGIVTEDGIHLANGTMVSILAHQVQTDEEKFEKPLKFDPYRFSRIREAASEAGKGGLNNLSMVSTSSEYLPFSHGKHACPGRFLVDFELKMIMAYAVMNYEMEFPKEYEGKRPPNTWFAGFGIPPLEVKIRVKRRRAN